MIKLLHIILLRICSTYTPQVSAPQCIITESETHKLDQEINNYTEILPIITLTIRY